MLSGILYVDKARGMTSHDVVAAVRRMTGIRAVGHTGTLDPETSGLLILCLGRATRFARFFEDLEKTYWTVVRLGICTDTQDATGTVVRQCEVPEIARAQLQSVLGHFTGPLKQIPPMYSAVKHQGQRLYRLARQGQTVVRQARDIVIQRLELLDVRGPEVTLAVTCSKGTYIRTLAEDIGLALGYGAHMLHLQRCRVGTVTVSQAYTLPCIQQHCQAGTLAEILVPVAQALAFLPALWLTVEQYKTLQTHQGSALAAILPVSQSTAAAASCYRLCTASDQTVAVIQRQTSAPEKWKVQGLVSP